MSSSIDINNVVNVALLPESQLAGRDNVNTVAIFTNEMGNVLSSSNRTVIYKNAKSVGEDFGTSSKAYQFAKVAFAQSPNVVQMGGYIVLAYWRSATEAVSAKAGYLTGGEVSESTLVGLLQSVSNGSMLIEVDNVSKSVTGLDFRTVDTASDIVTLIDNAIAGATVSYENGKLKIISSTTGASSAVEFATANTSGTFIGDILAISAGSGAVQTAGTDSATLTAETKETAVSLALASTPFVGFGFIDAPTDSEREDLSTFAKANNKIGYDVVTGASTLEKDVDNIVWANKLATGTNYRFIHSQVNNRALWIAYASRCQAVNYNAENSALTMHLKALNGVSAEYYTDNEIAKAKAVGCDVYTLIKDVPVVMTSGANDFIDNVFNLIAYVSFVQVDTFNLLKQTATKIPQTTSGVQTIVDIVEKTTKGFVRAGVFAGGVWSSPDFFGNIEIFKRNIEKNGYYVLAGNLADQAQSDRQERKSPVIQVAVKNSGAIHSVDIIINFNI